MMTPEVWILLDDLSSVRRPIARRMRASASAGPADSRITSSTPQSDCTAVSPPSVSTSSTGTVTPVVTRILHSDLALARSSRASTRIRSAVGAVTSDAGSAGMLRVRWFRSPSAGNTSLSTVEVRINNCATNTLPRVWGQCSDAYYGRVNWLRGSIGIVWGAALVGAVLVGVFAGSAFLVWIPVVLGALVIMTSAIQLAIHRRDGFVTRMIASLGGGLVILVVASAVLIAIHPDVALLPSLD